MLLVFFFFFCFQCFCSEAAAQLEPNIKALIQYCEKNAKAAPDMKPKLRFVTKVKSLVIRLFSEKNGEKGSSKQSGRIGSVGDVGRPRR
jgi:hypothetical protein